jgi:hypothetical protein
MHAFYAQYVVLRILCVTRSIYPKIIMILDPRSWSAFHFSRLSGK